MKYYSIRIEISGLESQFVTHEKDNFSGGLNKRWRLGKEECSFGIWKNVYTKNKKAIVCREYIRKERMVQVDCYIKIRKNGTL